MSNPPPVRFEITRETVRSGLIRDYMRANDPSMRLRTDAEHIAGVAEMLAKRPDDGGDIWLFAYGSLIWNPMVRFVEQQVATVRGYHRRFCLWTHLGRGSPEAPGLVLGLERGGICRGVAYRIEAAIAREELELVWRREMASDGYRARWLRITTEAGDGWAIGFVINLAHPRYAGRLAESEVAAAIAHAKGALGPCAAYLFNTVSHLEALGVRDRRLMRLRDQVEAALAAERR